MHQPGFIVVETNYRLYAYTGESGRGWVGREWGGKRHRRKSSSGYVYCVVYVAPRHLFLHLRVGLEESRAGQPPHSSSFIPGSESELQIALIALFSEMLYRFPNMVVAQVTRESVQQAIASGITAQQVSLHGLEVRRRAVLVLGGKVFLSLRHSLRSVRGAGELPG